MSSRRAVAWAAGLLSSMSAPRSPVALAAASALALAVALTAAGDARGQAANNRTATKF
jgi:hypothetical protein